ncbi:hypothetical protein BKA83DRAFT_4130587 [Pisolithus microcarpus]|nr:hypothetical protein BKA83DRAFT_4130587 [Pisolithus microcarpus]
MGWQKHCHKAHIRNLTNACQAKQMWTEAYSGDKLGSADVQNENITDRTIHLSVHHVPETVYLHRAQPVRGAAGQLRVKRSLTMKMTHDPPVGSCILEEIRTSAWIEEGATNEPLGSQGDTHTLDPFPYLSDAMESDGASLADGDDRDSMPPNQDHCWELQCPPNIEAAKPALADIQGLLRPWRADRKAHPPADLGVVLEECL